MSKENKFARCKYRCLKSCSYAKKDKMKQACFDVPKIGQPLYILNPPPDDAEINKEFCSKCCA